MSHEDHPAWWRPTPSGPATFHPSLHTAAEIVAAPAPTETVPVTHPSAA